MTLGLRSKFVIVSITAIYRSMGFWHRRCLKFMILSRMIMCSIASWRRLSFRVCGKLSRLAFQSSISISSCPLKDLAVISWIFAKQIDFRLFIFTDDFEFSTSLTKNVCVFKSTMISRKISKKMKNEPNENNFFSWMYFFVKMIVENIR